MPEKNSLKDAAVKLEHFCAYQERCHKEVVEKLYKLNTDFKEQNEIIVHLIQNDFLNEERFARAFARGKHRIKHWGKNRITQELKLRNISSANIKCGLSEIDEEEYFSLFETISLKFWEGILEKNSLKKRKKFCDYFLRKGWESDMIYEKVKELESSTNSD